MAGMDCKRRVERLDRLGKSAQERPRDAQFEKRLERLGRERAGLAEHPLRILALSERAQVFPMHVDAEGASIDLRRPQENQAEEHLEIEFDGGTRVYVPASKIELVQKYVGGSKSHPTLAKLGGKAWVRQKQAAEEAVVEDDGETESGFFDQDRS